MFIIGCDFHSRFQQIAMLDPQTGEVIERRLEHENGEARRFYAGLPTPARVGMEATGYAQWFERMLGDGTGVRTDDWASRTLPEEQEASELSGPKSQ